MRPELAGRTALITGASGGLGRACAEALALRGAALVINGRNAKALAEAAEALAGYGVAVTPVAGDVGEPAVRARLASGAIDILVANAGGPPPAAFAELDPDAFRVAFETNAIAMLDLARACLPDMRARGFGRIVTILSSAAIRPMPGLDASAGARAAVIAALRGPAREAARDGVTINHILPGPIATGRTEEYLASREAEAGGAAAARAALVEDLPAARLGKPEEVGALCGYLASPLAGFVTGQSVCIDGGRSI
ncbi:MAG: 3-oxoacyl-[acyl-carrier protein] reductase [Saliniramus fredricksonii]|uniref:3-oxoacyl-[acyl-carrier protein] reductase n=1 Tax=Saliniramus fredricksonii TaxID=1653334 RepID=A0A0P8A545_9HYPH|nr:SDR family oxidoreductase [Saliniramus fredricksonii]KPQ10359.1 MAG: 3-oxoacyl-[acyl-carrier protein] reductase [Saliniramus fredricksonii]SCC79657.1 3-oxoacyl-[acyl-carrier protein] reductase [Saliniramus fredricksonii]